MTTTILTLLILYGVYRWSISWIEYYSKLDKDWVLSVEV